jgi:hypothetical protein
MTLVTHGRFPGGFAWIAHPDEFAERSSVAFVHRERIWLIDPVRAPGLEAELSALGSVAGVILTLDRHDRDAAWFAHLYGVPVYRPRNLVPVRLDAPVVDVEGQIPDSPFQLLTSNGRGLLSWWRECGIWWPEERTLAIGDTLGTANYFIRPGERLAVHPLRRLSPPTELLTLRPERVYGGHGVSLTTDASAAVEHAIRTARSELAPAWGHSLRVSWQRLLRSRHPPTPILPLSP